MTDATAPTAAAPAAPPYDAEALLAALTRAGVAARTVRHPPLRTVAESKALRGDLGPGTHVKNLFLRRDPKSVAADGGPPFLLAVLGEDRALSVNALARRLGAGRVSMAGEADLWRVLGVRPGAVTPLGLFNARPGEVRAAFDAAALAGPGPVHVHPLTNEATTALDPADLLRLLRGLGHAVEVVDLDAAPGGTGA